MFQAKWILTWINEGVHGNRTVFPASVYRNVSYSCSVAFDHPNAPGQSIGGYGMGWLRDSYRGHDVRDEHRGFSSPIANDTLGSLAFRRASWAFYTRCVLTE